MQYYGFVEIPHTTYDEWRSNTLGNGYDIDGYYGDQCWDFVSEFWRNVGFPAGYPLTGPNHAASECWTVNRFNNTGYDGEEYFILINNPIEIKRGDIVFFSGLPGHTGFADEDYLARQDDRYIKILGQNQGGTPAPIGGTFVDVRNNGVNGILGAFRYKAWHREPRPREKSRFPWHLIAKKLRNDRIY